MTILVSFLHLSLRILIWVKSKFSQSQAFFFHVLVNLELCANVEKIDIVTLPLLN